MFLSALPCCARWVLVFRADVSVAFIQALVLIPHYKKFLDCQLGLFFNLRVIARGPDTQVLMRPLPIADFLENLGVVSCLASLDRCRIASNTLHLNAFVIESDLHDRKSVLLRTPSTLIAFACSEPAFPGRAIPRKASRRDSTMRSRALFPILFCNFFGARRHI